MSKIRLTKMFNFEAAHALYGYDGKCRNIHGHSYKLRVTVIGTPINDIKSPKNGMVIDFLDIKKIVKTNIVNLLDHAIILNTSTPHANLAEKLEKEHHNIIKVDYQPTSENMLIDFSKKIRSKLPKNIKLHHLKLQETPSSFAEWFAEDNTDVF